MTAFNLRVNGAELQAEAEPRTHLADFLREGLLLTGTHLGCEHGVCGACTVLLDGEPARACITYAADCAGREVCTIGRTRFAVRLLHPGHAGDRARHRATAARRE